MVCPGFVFAEIFSDDGEVLQGIVDGATVGGPSSIDVTTDMLSDAADSHDSEFERF